jgi:MFS family permease
LLKGFLVERRRKLPVVQADDVPSHSPAAWLGFGVLAILVSWIPLTASALGIVGWAIGKMGEGAPLIVVLGICFLASAISLIVGSIFGGYVVGRWGPHKPVTLGALAGSIAGALAGLLSGVVAGIVWTALVSGISTAVIAGLGGAMGAWVGARMRATRGPLSEALHDE